MDPSDLLDLLNLPAPGLPSDLSLRLLQLPRLDPVDPGIRQGLADLLDLLALYHRSIRQGPAAPLDRLDPEIL